MARDRVFPLRTSAGRRLLLALCLSAAAALGPEPSRAGGAPDSFADLVQALTPAVVNISTFEELRPGEEDALEGLPPGSPFEDYFDYFERDGGPEGGSGERVPTPRRMVSLGSGFIVDADGYVVTNNHVIEGADDIAVLLDDGTRLAAAVVGRDAKTDLALLKIEADRPLPYVRFGDSDRVRVGDWIVAVGNPFGLGNTVTAGIISARGRDINAGPYDDFLQTDAPINRGNSGGPMFDMDGEVVGVNTLIFSPSGGSVGIGFATPSALAAPVIEQLEAYGHVRRGWLGARIQEVSPERAHALGLPARTGALVASITAAGPADRAGIEQGDVIVSFNGAAVTSHRSLPRLVAAAPIGAAVPVVVRRGAGEFRLSVEIGELAEGDEWAEADAPEFEASGEAATTVVPGLALQPLSDELRSRFGIGTGIEGVVVTGLAGDARDAGGLKLGDVILEAEGVAVTSPRALAATIEALRDAGQARAELVIERAGQRLRLALPLARG